MNKKTQHSIALQNAEKRIGERDRNLLSMALLLAANSEIRKSTRDSLIKVARLPSCSAEIRTELLRLARDLEKAEMDKTAWERFHKYFDTVEPGFARDLMARFPLLTKQEVRVCELMTLQLTTKEIASVLGISWRSLQEYRFHVRKKLHVKREQLLSDILEQLKG